MPAARYAPALAEPRENAVEQNRCNSQRGAIAVRAAIAAWEQREKERSRSNHSKDKKSSEYQDEESRVGHVSLKIALRGGARAGGQGASILTKFSVATYTQFLWRSLSSRFDFRSQFTSHAPMTAGVRWSTLAPKSTMRRSE